MTKYLGRPVLQEIDFFDSGNLETQGRFHNLYAAQRWAREHGYAFGNTCAMSPIALMPAHYTWIAKWKNLTKQEREEVYGVCVSWDKPDTYKIFIFIQVEAHKEPNPERSVATMPNR